MATKRWSDLSTRAKAGIILVAAVDAGLRSWALRDLAARPKDQVRGPKWAWAGGISVLGTSGVVPVVYLVWGRTRPAQIT
ncbi:hypothetical protein [[Mycobacterium] burgundiense]|jgi:hypothetical protein|uniref:Cardiolipin synthase N-terminal domain-containing protein n=1 Tax=[Mycobacterium] burgundiense TaxID=3064286 RepID=A0ABM9LYV7_9MYCO|nr:hypothetical protein [Mycolicibacterium sp. MU0053]CAJ1507137.1 hypothetical protein MU0053_003411 [Mycolicibacterium sp. MU0053]